MHFTSGTYYAFLIAVFFIYWLAARRIPVRTLVLVTASLIFYLIVGGRFVFLLLAISAIDFNTARLMSRFKDQTIRRRLLFVSLALDIGVLSLFKYWNFLLEAVTEAVSVSGASIALPHLSLIVPIGISFFTFQSIAYVVDVYRGDTESAENYIEYLAFITFFPTIIAGPILRAKHLLPQLRSRLVLDSAVGGQALFLILIGLMKKIAIADYLGANLIDRVFDFPERFSSLEVLAGIYGYALQIYCDFSGYSDIAIGSAMLLGFSLPINFNAPYRAADLPDFWRRWHISLSSWLRDYVFFTVARGRARRSALYIGVLATMLVGGLWHGPEWTFVLWGLLHGIGLIVVRIFASLRKPLGSAGRFSRWSTAVGTLLTFNFVCFAWIFFRAENASRAIAVLHQVFSLTTDTSNLTLPVLLIIMIGFITHWMPDTIFEGARTAFVRLPAPLQACALFGVALGLYVVATSDVAPFIYSRF